MNGMNIFCGENNEGPNRLHFFFLWRLLYAWMCSVGLTRSFLWKFLSLYADQVTPSFPYFFSIQGA